MGKQSFYSNLDKESRYVLNVCFFIFAVSGLFVIMTGSILPFVSREYNLSNTVSGALISAQQTGNLIAGIVAGVLPLYMGRKNSVLFLYSFVILGFLTIILTGNPLLLIIGFLFTGITRGAVTNFNNAIVSEVSNSSSGALNFLHGIFAIGALISPYLVIFSTNLLGDSGWRLAVGIIVVFNIISFTLLSRIRIKDTFSKEAKRKGFSHGFLKEKNFWICSGILFFYLCAEATINGWIVKYFIDSGIMEADYAQVLASLLWGVILVGRITCTFIGDRILKKQLLFILSTGTFLFYLLLLLTRNPATITIAIAGLGFFMGGINPTTIAAAGVILKQYPMALSILLTLGNIGAILMPTITGALADGFGIFAGMSAILVAAFLMVICAAFVENTKG